MKTALLGLSFLVLGACGKAQSSEVKEARSFVPIFASTVPGSCTSHLAYAGTNFMCPGNKVVTGIGDNQAEFGRFETIRCCSIRTGIFAANISFAHYQVAYTGMGLRKLCPTHYFMKGIGFDSSGAAGTMHCYRMIAGGLFLQRSGLVADRTLVSHGSAYCGPGYLGYGLADTTTPDGAIDNLNCIRAYRP